MKLAVLAVGVVAWLGVAIVAVLVVDTWSDDNQVAAFFPIAAAVVVAWLIGERVTEHVFAAQHKEEAGHGPV